jgi:hypothetical protein
VRAKSDTDRLIRVIRRPERYAILCSKPCVYEARRANGYREKDTTEAIGMQDDIQKKEQFDIWENTKKVEKMLQMKVCKKVDEQAYVKELTANGSNIDSLDRVGIDSGELA